MKFSINLPLDHIHPAGEFQTPEAVRELAQTLERSKASAARLTDHPVPSADWLHNDPTGHDTLDPFTGLAFVAASTTRLRLMTSVIVLPYRNPFLTAKAAATLQVLSGGRLILGVGAGYQKGEFDALGVPFNERGALTDEALETIRLAWAGGAVVKRGKYFDAVGNEPRPAPSPPPPIWVGGGSDKAIARAARWGDGWAPYFSLPTENKIVADAAIKSVPELALKIRQLKDLREGMGKSAPFDIAITPPYFPKSQSRSEAERFCETLHELDSAGVTWLSVGLPARNRSSYVENVAWFSEEIISPFTTQAGG